MRLGDACLGKLKLARFSRTPFPRVIDAGHFQGRRLSNLCGRQESLPSVQLPAS